MNLPELTELRNNQSTYITFTKALVDFDKAVANNEPYYFTKMVAIKLPIWENAIDLTSVGVISDIPNVLFPKAIQYYMENICRQDISTNATNIEEITELAFWKLLNFMGLAYNEIPNIVSFVNSISVSNFIKNENNNGWGEIVCEIPNKCAVLNKAWKTIPNVKDIVQSPFTDGIFDNGNLQFTFNNFKTVFDFDNCSYNLIDTSEFEFNALLLYYTDSSNVQKLHGINFIYPFETKFTYWDLQTFKQKTNTVQTLGYQFKFNMKTCNNEQSQIMVYNEQSGSFYNNFSDTLGKLNQFLELKMRENG